MTPPVWISQSFTVPSLLPDVSNVPSNEKVRDPTSPVCPERMATQMAVIPSRVTISPEPKPTVIASFQCARAAELLPKGTVQEHVPQPAGSPLTILTSLESSAM